VALSDRNRPAGDRRGRVELAGRLALEGERHEQVATLDTVLVETLNEPLRAPEPAAPAGHVTGRHEVHTQPKRGLRRRRDRFIVKLRLVGTSERLDVLLVAAEHVAGDRQQPEVAGGKRPRAVSDCERGMGISPGAPGAQRTAPLELLVAQHAVTVLPTEPRRRRRLAARLTPQPYSQRDRS